MVSNGRNLWHAFTRMIKFVVVDEIHLSVFNMVHHNWLNCAQNVGLRPLCLLETLSVLAGQHGVILFVCLTVSQNKMRQYFMYPI
jgi:hypothetical protein